MPSHFCPIMSEAGNCFTQSTRQRVRLAIGSWCSSSCNVQTKFRRRNKDVLAQVTRSDAEADTHPLPLRRPVNALQSWGLFAASPLTPSATMCDIERPRLGFHRRLFFLRVPHGGRKDLRIEAACLPSLSVTDQIRCAIWLRDWLNGRVEYSQHDGTIVCFRGFVTLCESTHLWCQWEKKTSFHNPILLSFSTSLHQEGFRNRCSHDYCTHTRALIGACLWKNGWF